MKTAEEKAKEYALKRYPITDPYDAHLPISDERGAVEEAFGDGAKFGFDMAIKKLVEFKNEDMFNPEPYVYEKQEVCHMCHGMGYYWPYNPYHVSGIAMEKCPNCGGTGFVTVKNG